MTEHLRVKAVGRNVLLDGDHLALASSAEAAFVIAWCLNTARAPDRMTSWPYADADEKRVQEFFA
jgi:hypothetical protein